MKRFGMFIGFFLALFVLYSGVQVHAAGVPQLINYQGYLINKDGGPVSDGKYKLSFNIYTSDTPGDIPVWGPQTFTNVSVAKGYFNVFLGQDKYYNSVNSAFGSDKAYLEIVVNDNIVLPRQQFSSLPYAIVAGEARGPVYIMDEQGNKRGSMQVNSEGAGTIETHADSMNVLLGSVSLDNVPNYSNKGCIAVKLGPVVYAMLGTDTEAQGYVYLRDFYGNETSMGVLNNYGFIRNGHVSIGSEISGKIDQGYIAVTSDIYKQMYSEITVGPANSGCIEIQRYRDEQKNSDKISCVNIGGTKDVKKDDLHYNQGYIGVCDSTGDAKAEMYVNSSNQGVIVADVKNFRMANPDQKGTEIYYACIEGPEAGVYIRGTARIINGKAVVKLPEHFKAVSNPKNITVRLTPLSADSKGLAVVNKGVDEFTVKELFNGTGTYDFDYLAMAGRKGYENYQVIRPVSNSADLKNKDMKIQ